MCTSPLGEGRYGTSSPHEEGRISIHLLWCLGLVIPNLMREGKHDNTSPAHEKMRYENLKIYVLPSQNHNLLVCVYINSVNDGLMAFHKM